MNLFNILLLLSLFGSCAMAEQAQALKLSSTATMGASNSVMGNSSRLPVASVQALKLSSAASIDFKFRYEGDASLLEMLQRWALLARYDYTFNGIKDLPVVPELRQVEAQSIREAVEKALGAYYSYALDVQIRAVIDDVTKNLHLQSLVVPVVKNRKTALPNATVGNTFSEQNFAVLAADQSLMQVFVRWAGQAGYKTEINSQLIDLAVFPKHTSRYPDYSLITSAKMFKTKAPLKDAIKQLLSLYSGIALEPFTVTVEDSARQLNIVSLVK